MYLNMYGQDIVY